MKIQLKKFAVLKTISSKIGAYLHKIDAVPQEDDSDFEDSATLSDSSRHRTLASTSSDRRRVFLFSSFYSCSSSGRPSGSWKNVIFLPV